MLNVLRKIKKKWGIEIRCQFDMWNVNLILTIGFESISQVMFNVCFSAALITLPSYWHIGGSVMTMVNMKRYKEHCWLCTDIQLMTLDDKMMGTKCCGTWEKISHYRERAKNSYKTHSEDVCLSPHGHLHHHHHNSPFFFCYGLGRHECDKSLFSHFSFDTYI